MNKYAYAFLTTLSLISAFLFLAWDKAIEAANTLMVVFMWSVIAVFALIPLGLLALGLWALSNRLIDNYQKWAEARLLAAQARQAAKQADNLIITAAPGEQVYIASDEDIKDRTVTALHLQQAYRANGSGDLPQFSESAAWAFLQMMHSTVSSPKAVTKMITDGQQGTDKDDAAGINLPERVDLLSLLGKPPSVERVVIGQAVRDGALKTVTIPLAEMVHVGMVASSGWGKSVGLQALALQLALATEPLEMAFIDLEGVTSTPFQRLNRLRYPIAYNEADAVAILQDLKGEMERRLALFGPHHVQKVSEYNALPDVKPLSTIAVFIDEATTILENNKEIHEELANIIIQLRKTGVFLFLAGQEMSARSMRPMIRRQLSSRFAFHAADTYQVQGLGMGREAVDLNVKGRAWTILPGQQKMLVQTPFIEATTIERILTKYGRTQTDTTHAPEMPAAPVGEKEIPGFSEEDMQFARFVMKENKSKRKAATLAYGKDYAGSLVKRGKRVLEQAATAGLFF